MKITEVAERRLHFGLGIGEYRKTLGSKYLTSQDAKKALKLLIPRMFLHGIQSIQEYGYNRERAVMNGLRQQGIQYLLQHPIFVCAVPQGNGMMMAIVDGHNRSRFSGRFPNIHSIPSYVFSVGEARQIFNRVDTNGQNFETDEQFADWLKLGIREAVGSFSLFMADERQPKVVPNVSQVNELTKVFKQFSAGEKSNHEVLMRSVTKFPQEAEWTLFVKIRTDFKSNR